ncbi:c-type cytochrome biogenesis protein CcmI [Azospirillum brasilense]|uniref:C-type cytochrome biogenesis protein CcmI n=2 Tax=Azospirillum brasilense TaxID=192 RepID=A0A0N7I7D4_AZOBR|nr:MULTISPECIES: c-type cytochrome biogenesis protein CcmI [Azospirillum]ALJ34179.1 cytochrome C biogenesis protein [Azospirillum brasilense]MDW7552837.1 c-type cytochrome biogenesis protein CcmI [Azospirillum brasilense]MDW7591971.1 c-type cytochrome biogenesis protein CcmI [Azospirillum brasilense]MDW7627752.1 c-type cytochrome biogenesis protein CcmI [Azospirillum brasilense]MDX5952779.1 c-type cytochrome biogenesis protein CcmI [Azospirillum brasilense]
MLFWIVAAALTAAVVLLIVPPLLRKPEGAAEERAAYDLEVYRDQLGELERDQGRGLISEAQAAAARAEIGRRMLAIADRGKGPVKNGAKDAKKGKPTAARTPRSAMALAALLAVLLPLGTLAVYGKLGRPELPAQPLASRNLDHERGGPPKNVLAAMDKLKAQLAETPDDPQGWAILGQAYAKMGRLPEAADALGKAVALAGDDLELLGSYGEVLISANGGTVPDEARKTFDRVLAKDPTEPRARFYAALARFQAGDSKDALERWSALLAESHADAPWVPIVRTQIAEAAKALNLDPAKVTPEPLPAQQQPPVAQNQGQGQGQAQGQTEGEDQQQMIRGMVDGLAARLEANPDDVDGWLRLSRSYGVMGESAKAIDAARKARERAPQRPDVLVAYASALLSAEPRSSKPGPMPEEAVASLRQALAAEPDNRDALWLLGLNAAGIGQTTEATDLWTRLLAQFKPEEPEYTLIRARLDSLKAGG